jgi:outer membrane murein-binding lipoprotein Lpp
MAAEEASFGSTAPAASSGATGSARGGRVDELEQQVAALQAEVAELREWVTAIRSALGES